MLHEGIEGLTTQQIEELNEIANSSVWLAGPAVFTARHLLGLEIDDWEEEQEFRMAGPTPFLKMTDKNNFSIWPNPANDVLNITFTDNNSLHVIITDYSGKIVSDTYGRKITLAGLNNGVYAVDVKINDNSMGVKKLVILK